MTDNNAANGEGRRYDPEMAARFRAAFAYAGKEPKDIAELLGVSSKTVYRLRSGRSEIDRDIQERVIELTGVPPWFFRDGFDRTEDPDLSERVEAVERQLQTLPQMQRSLRELQAGLATLSASSLRHTREQRGQGGTDRPEERPGEGD